MSVAARPDLLAAASNGDLQALTEALLACGNVSEVLAAADVMRGYTLLHAAVTSGQRLAAALLIGAGAPVDQEDRFGHSPRSYARHTFRCQHLADLFGLDSRYVVPDGDGQVPGNLSEADGLLLALRYEQESVLA